jgi:hypothetical protein
MTNAQSANDVYQALNMDRVGTWAEIEATIAETQ